MEYPDYTEQLSVEQKREFVLHRVLAGSAFVFALCILPVAQYLLKTNQSSDLEGGQVAGVSTNAPADRAMENLASSPEASSSTLNCQEQKDKALVDLDRFLSGMKLALSRNYSVKIAPYQTSLNGIQGDSPKAIEERGAIQKLILTESNKYQAELAKTELAVSKERASTLAQVCL